MHECDTEYRGRLRDRFRDSGGSGSAGEACSWTLWTRRVRGTLPYWESLEQDSKTKLRPPPGGNSPFYGCTRSANGIAVGSGRRASRLCTGYHRRIRNIIVGVCVSGCCVWLCTFSLVITSPFLHRAVRLGPAAVCVHGDACGLSVQGAGLCARGSRDPESLASQTHRDRRVWRRRPPTLQVGALQASHSVAVDGPARSAA